MNESVHVIHSSLILYKLCLCDWSGTRWDPILQVRKLTSQNGPKSQWESQVLAVLLPRDCLTSR